MQFPTRCHGILLAGLAALAGCSCPYYDSGPPQLTLAFGTDTLANGLGFRRAEVRSAYLVRYAATDLPQMLDTLRQPTAPTSVNARALYFSREHPPIFALPEYVRQNIFARSFRLVVPAASRSYDITNIVIEHTASGGRCSMDRITRQEVTVNGLRRDALNQVPELTK